MSLLNLKPLKAHRLLFACGCLVVLNLAQANVTYRAGQILPFSGGGTKMIGDLVFTDDGAAEVISCPSGSAFRLMFYRFGPDARILVERQHAIEAVSFYGPSLCWDGQNFGVVAATLTQSVFLILSPSGDVVLAPLQLPGLPSGAGVGRTAAFKVLWTGQAFAVFGLWLEKQYPLQDLTAGNFYTHLHYWLLDAAGQTLTHRELRHLAPMTYPGIEGAEKNYYDVVWTGTRFFLAYYSESQSGPPLSVYYQTFDLNGTLVRAESPLFANQVAQGPRLAWNGRTLAATALKTISMPSPSAGNYMYTRTFDAEGVPHAVEAEYGQQLGYGPTIFWAGDKFLTAYCVMYDWANLGYTLMFTAFNEVGQKLAAEYPLRNEQGTVMLGRMALGVDLQFTSGAKLLFGKAQTSDAWGLSATPFVFALNGDAVIAPTLTLTRVGDKIQLAWPAEAEGFTLQQTLDLNSSQWTVVPDVTDLQNGQRFVTLPMIGARFFRLVQ